MKQLTNKPATILGHNNPPEDIKSIEFTNTAIEKLKVENLDFKNKRYIEIPFVVSKGSHLKGLVLTISKATKTKNFTLRFWMNERYQRYNLGTYKSYKNSNDLGFTCVQVNKKQYDIYQEHTNDKGLYLTNPKVADKIKHT